MGFRYLFFIICVLLILTGCTEKKSTSSLYPKSVTDTTGEVYLECYSLPYSDKVYTAIDQDSTSFFNEIIPGVDRYIMVIASPAITSGFIKIVGKEGTELSAEITSESGILTYFKKIETNKVTEIEQLFSLMIELRPEDRIYELEFYNSDLEKIKIKRPLFAKGQLSIENRGSALKSYNPQVFFDNNPHSSVLMVPEEIKGMSIEIKSESPVRSMVFEEKQRTPNLKGIGLNQEGRYKFFQNSKEDNTSLHVDFDVPETSLKFQLDSLRVFDSDQDIYLSEITFFDTNNRRIKVNTDPSLYKGDLKTSNELINESIKKDLIYQVEGHIENKRYKILPANGFYFYVRYYPMIEGRLAVTALETRIYGNWSLYNTIEVRINGTQYTKQFGKNTGSLSQIEKLVSLRFEGE